MVSFRGFRGMSPAKNKQAGAATIWILIGLIGAVTAVTMWVKSGGTANPFSGVGTRGNVSAIVDQAGELRTRVVDDFNSGAPVATAAGGLDVSATLGALMTPSQTKGALPAAAQIDATPATWGTGVYSFNVGAVTKLAYYAKLPVESLEFCAAFNNAMDGTTTYVATKAGAAPEYADGVLPAMGTVDAPGELTTTYTDFLSRPMSCSKTGTSSFAVLVQLIVQ